MWGGVKHKKIWGSSIRKYGTIIEGIKCTAVFMLQGFVPESSNKTD